LVLVVVAHRTTAADLDGLEAVEKQDCAHDGGNQQRGMLHQRVAECGRGYEQESQGNLQNAYKTRAVPGRVIVGNDIGSFEIRLHVLILHQLFEYGSPLAIARGPGYVDDTDPFLDGGRSRADLYRKNIKLE
jgi:hypothetical protein